LLDATRERFDAEGVGRGHIVAWLAHNRWEMLAALAECERRGAVLMPLNWRLAPAELARLMQHAGAGHLLHGVELDGAAAALRDRLTLVPAPAEGIEPGDLLLVYTSGTTGEPKGALHTVRGMRANREAAIAVQGFDAGTRVLSVLPLFHVGGLAIQTLPVLAAGGALQLHARFDPEAWFDDVERWRPTTTLLVPAVMRALVEHPRWAAADLSALAFVNSGSQIVPRALIEAFHARGVPVAQVYGSTETGPVSIVLEPGEALAHAGHAGRPAPGVTVRLAGDGEVLLKAPNVMRGYHRSALPASDAEGWFHTGDLAVQHADGCYEIVGRSKELVISGGENIHPAEIEQLVAERPEVAECAVVGLPDARWGEVPVLAVQLKPGRTLDRVALQALLDARLARFKHPRRIEVVAELPRTALGKVQREVLAARLAPVR
jgi:fatty-acyl-CoA synthase